MPEESDSSGCIKVCVPWTAVTHRIVDCLEPKCRMQETEVNISSTVDGVESKSPKKEIEGRRLSRNTRNHRNRKHNATLKHMKTKMRLLEGTEWKHW